MTGIRFVAASLVFFHHIRNIPRLQWLIQYPLFNFGPFSVAFFFVLSGFILTYNYARVFEGGVTPANYVRFIWDRISKIYPLYLLTLLCAFPSSWRGAVACGAGRRWDRT